MVARRLRVSWLAAVVALVTLAGAGAGLGGWYLGQRSGEAASERAPGASPTAHRAPPTTGERLGALIERAQRDPTDWRSHVAHVDALPAFTEPPDGPRAPSSDAFGLVVGVTTLREAEAFVRDRGLICADTSVRAMMASARDEKAAQIAEARAHGAADGLSGASWLWRSTAHERSPHVRLTCPRVRLALLGDRARPQDTVGRLLLMFDSPDHPLRHVTIQRLYADDAHAAARRAFIDADAAMRATFGEPHIARRDPPAEGEVFAKVTPVRRDWTFADLRVKVSALRLDRGVTIYEEIGVPYPIRPDAPALAEAPAR